MWLVPGVPGVTGLSVPRRVEEELKRRREIVTLATVVKPVRERTGRRETVTLKAVILQVRNNQANQNFFFHRKLFFWNFHVINIFCCSLNSLQLLSFLSIDTTFLYFPVGHVDGGWGNWESWSQCSKTCGGGKTERLRECDSPPASGGRQCQGDAIQTRDCKINLCKLF